MAQPTTTPPPEASVAPAGVAAAGVLPTAVPAAVGALAAAHRLRQQILARRATNAARRLWSLVDPHHAQASWDAQAGPAMTRLMTAVQAEAARGAQDYVDPAVQHWGNTPNPAGQVVTGAFAGVAADGRPLESLLSYPAFEVDAFVADGMDPGTAMMIGQRHLERIVVTETQDAARVATGVAQVNDRTVRGYVRMLTPPSCSRCVVLAGKFYWTNAGFERHPQCDCVHIPAVEHLPDLATDPKRYFDSLNADEQDRVFTKAGARAIRDGADFSQVVNARRGMEMAGESRTRVNDRGQIVNERHRTLTTRQVFGRDVYTTTEGITKRGVAGRSLGKRNRGVRLMPESIYAEAQRLGWSRDEIIRQLKRFGYIL